MGYRHIVLFRIHDDVSEERVDQAVDVLHALGEVPGVREWTVRRSDDERKGRIVVQNALLGSAQDLEGFRSHPRHARTAAVMRDIADWWIADYPEEGPGTVR